MSDYKYDVALSFADEQRTFVRGVAEYLKEKGVRVFFDEFEQVDLWGKDLGDKLDEIYRTQSRYVVMFISEDYVKKRWINHERKSAFARRILNDPESVLPVRFDDTELPGLSPTVAYIPIKDETEQGLADKIEIKVKASEAVARATESATNTGSLSLDSAQKPILKYCILGLSDKQLWELFSVFGDNPPTESAKEAGYVDVVLDDWSETQAVFAAIAKAGNVANAEAAKKHRREWGIVFLEAIGEEVLKRAGDYMFSVEEDSSEIRDQLAGLRYIILGVREEFAQIIQHLRPAEMIAGPKSIERDAYEVFFEDFETVRAIPEAMARFSAGVQQGGDPRQLLYKEVTAIKLKQIMRKIEGSGK
jgi:hypothetical protein